MNYDEEDDTLLMDMVCETNEEARDSLYEKYKPIIDMTVKKYASTARKLGLDLNDLNQEANVGFTDAINHYDSNKEASFKTFIQICIERKIINYLKKHKSTKYKTFQESLSLDYEYDEKGNSLKETLADISSDPSLKLSDAETIKTIREKIKTELSDIEYEVFLYMLNNLNYNEIARILDKSPKQIDNTMQRIRMKLTNILNEE